MKYSAWISVQPMLTMEISWLTIWIKHYKHNIQINNLQFVRQENWDIWRYGMTYNAINELIVSAESSGHENFWEYDGEFFMLFYNSFKYTLFTNIPDIAFMYMEINNWQGMSIRCWVWQYYERSVWKEENCTKRFKSSNK